MLKKFFVFTLICVYLTGCSGTRIQTSRLNSVEDLVYDAESALKSKSNPNYKQYATESLGSASAYLLTLKDFKKSMNMEELKRYNYLLQRVSTLQKSIK